MDSILNRAKNKNYSMDSNSRDTSIHNYLAPKIINWKKDNENKLKKYKKIIISISIILYSSILYLILPVANFSIVDSILVIICTTVLISVIACVSYICISHNLYYIGFNKYRIDIDFICYHCYKTIICNEGGIVKCGSCNNKSDFIDQIVACKSCNSPLLIYACHYCEKPLDFFEKKYNPQNLKKELYG